MSEIEKEKNNYPEPIEIKYEFTIPKGQAPERLDQFLTHAIRNASRTKVQKAIEEGRVLVNGMQKKVSYKIAKNDFILHQLDFMFANYGQRNEK